MNGLKRFWSVGVILFLLTPVAVLIVNSFAFGWRWGEVLPQALSLRGWAVLWDEPRLPRALMTSLFIGIGVILLNFLIALPAARTLAFYSFKGKGWIETILSLPILVPSLAVVMGVHLAMIRAGLSDTVLGVILVHLIPTVPYSIKILRAGFERMGSEWESQVVTLGGNKLHAFYTIYFPRMISSFRSIVFLVFVISLSQFAITAIIGGGNVVTLSMLYFPFLNGMDTAVVSSFSLIFALLPILIVFLFEGFFYFFQPYKNRMNKR